MTYPELQSALTDIRNEIAASGGGGTGGASGSRLRINFAPELAGCDFTVTSADGLDTQTGVVNSSTLTNVVDIAQQQTVYTVEVAYAGGNYSNTVLIGEYYGEYRVNVATFMVTFNVSTGVVGATVTASLDGGGIFTTGVTANDGTVALDLLSPGTWAISATYRNYSVDCDSTSVTQTLTASNDGGTFNASLTFTSLTLTGIAGAVVTLASGGNTMTFASTGTDRVYLPRATATWTLNATYASRGANCPAQTKSITVAEGLSTYTATLVFTTLTLTSPSGSSITLTPPSGSGTITATSTGSDLFYLPTAGTWTIAATLGSDSESTTTTVTAFTSNSATIDFVHIYGARWAATADPTWERTDEAASFVDPVPYVLGMTAGQYSSPFDNLYPWCEMTKVERAAGTMVKIPKFWYKLESYATGGLSLKIADSALDGYFVSPAHMDRGDGVGERDVVYVGRYHCATSTYKSTSGVKPQASITRSTARTTIHNLGTNIWQLDFATRYTLWLLYLVEYANWNSQAKIGYGCGNNSSTQNMGTSDSMPYHTGTMQSSRTTYGVGVQYRNIEDLWGNVYDWLDGCYYNGSGLNLIKNPANFSDTANGAVVGVPSSGYPSAFAISSADGYLMFYPTAASGSDSTFSCDNWYFSSGYPCLFVGGYCGRGTSRGLFYVDYATASNSVANVGARLLELP